MNSPGSATQSPLIVKNKLELTCIIFTAVTVFASLFNLYTVGIDAATGDLHILLRLLIVGLAIGSLYIFEWFQDRSQRIVLLIHYLVTMGAVFGLVWASGFVIELHPDAYRDIFLNYTGLYVILVLGEFLYLRARDIV